MTTKDESFKAFLASPELEEVSSSKFRIKNKRLHLTYRGHINQEELLNFLEGLQPVKFYSIVHEMGVKTSYLHTHCLVEFEMFYESKTPRCLDYQGIHPNIKKVTAQLHWDRVLEYHRKDGTPFTNTTVKPKVDVSIAPKEEKKKKEKLKPKDVWTYESAQEAVEQLGNERGIGCVAAVVQTFKYKPAELIKPMIPNVKWWPWQEELFNEINQPCTDNRTIIWYVDVKGGCGKTAFTKHMAMYYGSFASTHSDSYHIATQLQGRVRKGAPVESVLINLGRSALDDLDEDAGPDDIGFVPKRKKYVSKTVREMYKGLEELKDGLITAKKNVGETIVFPSPHLVVFANSEPIFKCLSQDRWDIRYISDDGKNVIKRFPETKQKRESPEEGYDAPGSLVHVAEPDTVLTSNPGNEDSFSSVSSPGKSKPFKYDSDEESIMAKSAVELVRKKSGDEAAKRMLEKLRKQKEEIEEEMSNVQKTLMSIKPKQLQPRPAYSDASSQ